MGMCTKPACLPSPAQPTLEHQSIYANVNSHYGAAAENGDSSYSQAVASAFGYSASELANAPAESNLGLSCGNPFAIANLRDGETVVDLGSGAGFDVFQAAKKVGVKGKAVGIDMNDDMLAKAQSIKQKTNAENTTFIKSRITQIDLPDSTADCVISNCVINLVPETEKQLVFNEMLRVLKPGGRVAVSDILLTTSLTDELKNDVALYVACVAGASKVEGYERYLMKAGFKDIMIVPDRSDLNIYKTASKNGGEVGCCGPSSSDKTSDCGNKNREVVSADLKNVDLNQWAGSYKIYAVKG